jgi:biopolymer transport protein ExbD
MILFKKKIRKDSIIEITPLIDIVFLLLIFFMINATFLQPAIKMNLPVLSSQGVGKKAKITLSIDKNRNIYLNNRKTDMNSLIQDIKATKTSKEITLRADKSLTYEFIVQVLEKLKDSGIKNISLEHSNKK